MKLVVVHTHPIQYVAPQFVWLSQQVSLKVLYLCSQNVINKLSSHSDSSDEDPGFGKHFTWDQPLLEGYDFNILRREGIDAIKNFRGIGLLPQCLSFINEQKPNAVLLYNHSPWIVAVLAFLLPLFGWRVILRTEVNDSVRKKVSRLNGIFRHLLLRSIYKRIFHFYPISSCGYRHLLAHGVDTGRITTVNYAPNTDWLDRQVSIWLPQRDILRQALNIAPSELVLLYAGRLAPEKDIFSISRSLCQMDSADIKRLHVVSVGSGPLESEWVRRMHQTLGNRFHHLGFLNQNELCKAYSI